jgi:hypothetical protein
MNQLKSANLFTSAVYTFVACVSKVSFYGRGYAKKKRELYGFYLRNTDEK